MTDPSLNQCGERITRLARDVSSLDRLIDLRFINLDRALTLQAAKDQQHFKDLNHEAQRITAAYHKFLPREIYDADKKNRLDTWLSGMALLISLATLAITLIRLSGQ